MEIRHERLPVAVATVCAATILVGVAARAIGDRLGAPLAPFFASWRPSVAVWAVPAVAVFVVAAALAPRLLRRPASPVAFAAAVFCVGLVLRLALAAARGGPGRWYAVFATDPEAAHEYLPALPALSVGLHAFLAHFAQIAPTLPTHPSGHPPGLLVTLNLLGIATARQMAALCIGVGALAVPLTYVLARSLIDERRARIAGLFFALAPSGLLYGATSADALYASLALAAAVALDARGRWWVVGGPAVLALASFFSFALVGVGVWVVLVQYARGDRSRAVRTAAAAGGGLAAFYAVLHAVSGFDVIATFHALNRDYRSGIASVRPYAFWVFGSPVAYLVALGLPLAWLALRSLGKRHPPAIALAGVIVISAVLGYTKAETERIWLFLVPLACIAAAAIVDQSRVGRLAWLLTVQAFAVELLLFTVW